MHFSISDPTLLTLAGCKYWARMPYWHLSDLILLSMGIDPAGKEEVKNTEEEAAALGHEFEMRITVVTRAGDLNEIETIQGQKGDDPGSYEVLYPPLQASIWADNNFPSFPHELYEAVLRRYAVSETGDFPETKSPALPLEEEAQKPGGQSTDGHQMSLNSNELNDRKVVQRGKPGADARWEGKRKPLVEEAEKFMHALLEIGCLCSHAKLARIAYKIAEFDGKPLETYDYKYFGLRGAINDRANQIVPLERRFGSPSYCPAACKCPIKDHKHF